MDDSRAGFTLERAASTELRLILSARARRSADDGVAAPVEEAVDAAGEPADLFAASSPDEHPVMASAASATSIRFDITTL